MTKEQASKNNTAVELNNQVRDWKKAIAANPTGYFEEIMAAELPALEEQARLANNAANDALAGHVFNTFTDDWEPINQAR